MYTEKRISDFSHKFNLAVDEAIGRKVDAILLLGDVFDSSAYRRSVDAFAEAVADIAESLVKLKAAGITIFAIAGNHEFGRGRAGGELRILSDLGIIRLMNDEMKPLGDIRIAGIPWKSEKESFQQSLDKLGKPQKGDILLIHQFCQGSTSVPSFLWEVTKAQVKDWSMVFAGHQHHYENLGYAIVPGSLEIQKADEDPKKGFVIYDTETGVSEFVVLPPTRKISYAELSGNGKTSVQFQRELEAWVTKNASEGALLVLKISGILTSGRSADVQWGQVRALAYQRGCLKLYFEGGLEDQVRTAPEIRSSMSLPDFFRKRFGEKKGDMAVDYVESLRTEGDEFYTALQDGIFKEVGAKKRS